MEKAIIVAANTGNGIKIVKKKNNWDT